MNSDFYIKTIEECRKMHLIRELENPSHHCETKDFMVFETALNLGRRTQKTKSAFELMSRSPHSLNVYVATTVAAAESAKKLYGVSGNVILTSKKTVLDYFRGRSIEHQAINLIFDECDLTYNERMDIVYHAFNHSVEKKHPLAYIHVISLGM